MGDYARGRLDLDDEDRLPWLEPALDEADEERISPLRLLGLIILGLALIGAVSLFAMDRVRLAADVWFIPVNRPASEDVCLYTSLVGVAMYIISILAAAAKGFCAKE